MKIRRFTDTGEWTTRRYLSLLGSVLIWLAVAVDAWYLWPTQLGGATSMVIVSGHSMEPTYFTGDLVISRKMTPSIGDVIIYAPEGLGGSQIVHRIIGGNAEDGWQMQGDNNNFVDPYTPKGDEVRGVVLVHYSNFGRVTALLLNPIVWAFVLLAALVLLLWWSDDCDDDDDDDEPDGASEDDDTADDGTGRVPNAGVLDPSGASPPNGEDAGAAAEPQAEPVAEPAVGRRADGGGIASRMARRVATLVAAVLVATGLGVAPASASQLTIVAPDAPAALSYDRCAAGSLAVTATGAHSGNQYTHLTVSGVAASCAGLPLTLYVHKSNGDLVVAGTGTASASTATVTTASFNANQVTTALVKINGWVFHATWTPPASPSPATCVPTDSNGNAVAGTCTVTSIAITDQWGTPGSRGANGSFQVTSTSGWFKITFDFSQSPLPGWYPHSISGNLTLPPFTACSALPLVTVRGPSWSNYQPPTYSYYFGISESGGNICP